MQFVVYRISERKRFYDSVISYTGDMEHHIKVCVISVSDIDTFSTLFAGFPTDSFKPVEVRFILSLSPPPFFSFSFFIFFVSFLQNPHRLLGSGK